MVAESACRVRRLAQKGASQAAERGREMTQIGVLMKAEQGAQAGPEGNLVSCRAHQFGYGAQTEYGNDVCRPALVSRSLRAERVGGVG